MSNATVHSGGAGTPAQRGAPAGGLLGAEIRTGTDPAGPLAALTEPYLGDLLTRAQSVLFAGPHPVDLVARALPGREITVLVRRAPDAERYAANAKLRGARVLCGPADRDTGSYDLVLALAGLEPVTSPDGTADGWSAALAALADRVAPDGAVVFAAANAFGLPRVHALAPDRTDPFTVGHDALARALLGAHLTVTAGLAVFPNLPSASLVVHQDLLDDPASRDLAGRMVAAATETRQPGELATGAARLARDAVRHGLAYPLAPAWVMVAVRPGSAADAVVPAVAVASRPGADPVVTDRAGSSGPVLADSPALGWRPRQRVPTGPLLSERLIDACGRHDLATVRDLVTRYAARLGVPTDDAPRPAATRPANPPVAPGQRTAPPASLIAPPVAPDAPVAVSDTLVAGQDTLVAVPDTLTTAPDTLTTAPDVLIAAPETLVAAPDALVDTGTELAAADPAAPATVPMPPRAAFLAGLAAFATELQGAGLPHPFPATLTPERLAVRLASMAGIAASDAEVAAVAAVPAAGAPAGPTGPLAPPHGYTEAVRQTSALSRELAEARAQLRFLTESVAERDLRLRQQSFTRRLLRFCRRPVRTLRGWMVRRAGRS